MFKFSVFQKLIPNEIKNLIEKVLKLWKTPVFGFIWIVLLFIISFIFIFQFFFFSFFLVFFFFILILRFIQSCFKKDNEFFIKYNYNNFNFKNNYVLFLKFIFIDLSKKWSFFYFYKFLQILNFFSFSKRKNNLVFKNFFFDFYIFLNKFFNFLWNYLIKYVLYLLTNFTYLILNLSLEITVKLQHFWFLNWSNYSVFFDNFLCDIVSTYNEFISMNIYNKKVIIKNKNILLNPNDKFTNVSKDIIKRSINNLNDVIKFSCDLKNLPFDKINLPHLVVSSVSNLNRSMTHYQGSFMNVENQKFYGLKYGKEKTIVSCFFDFNKFIVEQNNNLERLKYSEAIHKNNLKELELTNFIKYKFNEKIDFEKNQTVLSPCIEIDNKEIKLNNINNGIVNLLKSQVETEAFECVMNAKNIILNFNNPLCKIRFENENGLNVCYLEFSDGDDTLKNRYLHNKNLFSIVSQPVLEDVNEFVESNQKFYTDPEYIDIFKKSFHFWLLQESKSGSLINMLEFLIKSDSYN